MTGYQGSTFAVDRYLRAMAEAARAAGFQVEDAAPHHALPHPLLALRRTCPNPSATLHLSAGMHGDEPAGPLAILRRLRGGGFPDDLSYVIFPLLNPVGMAGRCRENAAGLDINRDYRRWQTPEARAHAAYLGRLPRRFDLCINLHEDWESAGCYIYEVNPDRETSIAPAVLQAAGHHLPIDLAEQIDGHPAEAGIIRPRLHANTQLRGDDYPETLYLIDRHTRHSYTFETPSNRPLRRRVAAQEAAITAALQALQTCGHWFDI